MNVFALILVLAPLAAFVWWGAKALPELRARYDELPYDDELELEQ